MEIPTVTFALSFPLSFALPNIDNSNTLGRFSFLFSAKKKNRRNIRKSIMNESGGKRRTKNFLSSEVREISLAECQ